jgi:conserved hypothetical protein TIGR00252
VQLFCAKYVTSFIQLFKQKIAETPHTRSKGAQGELLAIKFLKKKGYTILQRNYRRRNGEIDVICYDRGTIVFVEVKTRHSDTYGPPELSVTEAKRRQIVKVASHYVANKKIEGIDLRFDVVSIFYPPDKKQPTITLFSNAFTKSNTALVRK